MDYNKRRRNCLKNIIVGVILIYFSFNSLLLKAQEKNDSIPNNNSWDFNAQLYLTITSDNLVAMPVFNMTKNHLYLQSRFNYESAETYSLSAGYLFNGGDKFSYEITPMMGIMLGKQYGFLPEISINLSYRNFNLSSDSEYQINLKHPKLNYISTWNEFTFYPKDWLYAGISVQRSRIFNTYLDVQKGIVMGVIINKFTFMGYLFNFIDDKHDVFGMLGVNFAFN